MNIERLLAVRQVILDEDKYFNMEQFFHGKSLSAVIQNVNDCGTPSCIAGHAIMLYPEESQQITDAHVNISGHRWLNAYDVAMKLLDLNNNQAGWLFCALWRCWGGGENMRDITRKQAAWSIYELISNPDIGHVK